MSVFAVEILGGGGKCEEKMGVGDKAEDRLVMAGLMGGHWGIQPTPR